MQKPRLTAKTVQVLDLAAGHIRADADDFSTYDGADEKAKADELYRAAEYIEGLCRWYRANHKNTK